MLAFARATYDDVMNAIRLSLAALVLASCGGSTAPSDAAGDTTQSNADVVTTIDATPGTAHIAQLAAGRYFTCARIDDGSIYCWGQGAYRALGNDTSYRGTATRVRSFADAIDLEAGGRFACAIRANGSVWCWGDNSHGQVGDNATTPCGDAVIDSVCVTTPQAMPTLASNAVQLALGNEHACVRKQDGTVWCWGNNANGQVSSAALSDQHVPVQVPGIAGAVQIVAGDNHSCALVGNPGHVLCWGDDGNAQVGNGTTTDAVPLPAMVAGVDDAVEIVAGGEHTCARHANGSVSCWGYDYLGQLGNGSTRPTRATTSQSVVGLGDAVQLVAGRYHTCARRADGSMMCWGHNSKGQAGDGTTTQQNAPVTVATVLGATTIVAGAWSTCAATNGGNTLLCWGDDLGGQLGDNRVTNDPVTVPVQTHGLP